MQRIVVRKSDLSPRIRRLIRNASDVHIHIDMPKAHAASGRGRTHEHIGKNNPASYWHVIVSPSKPDGRRYRTIRFGKDILARAYFFGGGAPRERSWKVGSLLFPKGKFTARAAAAWAAGHGYNWKRVEG